MNKRRIALLTCASLILVSILLIKGFGNQTAHAAFVSNACGSWSIIPSANTSSSADNSLSGVSALSTSDAWAVGEHDTQNSYNNQTLTEHWNGSQWNIVASPNATQDGENTLNAVAEISANDVWAVGSYYSIANLTTLTLIEHWNGSQWQIVPSPNPNAQFDELEGIAAISSNNIWAVGNAGTTSTLVEHWDGSSWSVVASPNLGTKGSNLIGVSAISSDDIWAVGTFINQQGRTRTLAEHWNGKKWAIVHSPDAHASANILQSVTAISTNDVWAVGYYRTYQPKHPEQTLTEHWNGSSWSIIPSANVPTTSDTLFGVAALSTNNVWAVGSNVSSNRGTQDALIEQWNGTNWNVVASPNPGNNSNYLSTVTVIPGSSQLWAGGSLYLPSGRSQTLTEAYC